MPIELISALRFLVRHFWRKTKLCLMFDFSALISLSSDYLVRAWLRFARFSELSRLSRLSSCAGRRRPRREFSGKRCCRAELDVGDDVGDDDDDDDEVCSRRSQLFALAAGNAAKR